MGIVEDRVSGYRELVITLGAIEQLLVRRQSTVFLLQRRHSGPLGQRKRSSSSRHFSSVEKIYNVN